MGDIPINMVTGDLDPTGSLTTDAEAVRQRLYLILMTVKGEDPLWPDVGVEYFKYVHGQKFNISYLNKAFIPAILSVDGVSRLAEPIVYTLNRSTRKMEAKFKIILDDGTLIAMGI